MCITYAYAFQEYAQFCIFQPSIFVLQDHESVVKAIYTGYEFLESVAAGNEVGLVLESTSFYAEQGGQVL